MVDVLQVITVHAKHVEVKLWSDTSVLTANKRHTPCELSTFPTQYLWMSDHITL